MSELTEKERVKAVAKAVAAENELAPTREALDLVEQAPEVVTVEHNGVKIEVTTYWVLGEDNKPVQVQVGP